MPQTEIGPIGGVLSLREFLNAALDMLSLGSSWNTEAQGKGGKRSRLSQRNTVLEMNENSKWKLYREKNKGQKFWG